MSFFGSSSSDYSNFMDPYSFTMHWQETALVVSAHLHGICNEAVKVEIRNMKVILYINEFGGQSCGNYYVKSIQLPENVNARRARSEIDNNGVLNVTVPKLYVPKKRNPPIINTNASRRHGCFFC